MSFLLHLNRWSAFRYYRSIVSAARAGFPDDVRIKFTFNDLNNPKVNPDARCKTYGSTKPLSTTSYSIMLDGKRFGMGRYGWEPFTPVSDQDFVDGVMTLCHELHHVRQHLACYGRTQYDRFSPDIGVSLIAASQNPYYYDLVYSRFLHEIDADTAGFVAGYKILSERFSDKLPNGLSDVDRLVMEHVHGGLGDTYVVDLSACSSIDDVAESLSRAYSRWDERLVRGKYDSAKMKPNALDEAYAVTQGLSGFDVSPWCVGQWKNAWNDFSYSRTMRDSCYRLCAITLKLHPQYADVYSCLESVRDDLSVAKLFPRVAGGEFSEPVGSIYARVWKVSPKTRRPGGVGENGFSDVCKVVATPDLHSTRPAPKSDRSVPEAVDIPPSRTPNYDSVERPAVRPQSCSGRSLCGLDVDPDNSNNVSDDFERS